MKEPIRAENALQNDLTLVLNGTRIATTAVDAVHLSPAATDRMLSDMNLHSRDSARVCLSDCGDREGAIEGISGILGHIQKINFDCLTPKHCGECSGVLR